MSAPVKYDVDGRVMIDGQSVVKSYANGLAFTVDGRLAVNNLGIFDPGRGYEPPVAYGAGIDMLDASQTVEYLGEVYAPVLADLPFTTSGTFETAKFRLIQGVASTDLAAPSGASMIGYTPAGTGAVATTVQSQLRKGLTAVDYAAGIVITEPGQLLRDTSGGLWNISPSETLPYTTTGAGVPEGGALVSVGDAALRQELAADGGAGLVGTSDGSTVQEKLDEAVFGDATLEPAPGSIPVARADSYIDAGWLEQLDNLIAKNAAALHRSPNAITALFVYDTSKDSDGGAWTQKCQHTSWYNESINGKWLGAHANESAARAVSGATTGDYFQLTTNGAFFSLSAGSGTTQVYRGNKRDFPRLVAIVAEAASVTIYDLTEAGNPMWMRFIRGGTTNENSNLIFGGSNTSSSVSFFNGVFFVGSDAGLSVICFAKDSASRIGSSVTVQYNRNIAQRNSGSGQTVLSSVSIASANIKAVAATVMPDAPVDPVSGLKAPTVVVAAGGVSVVKHDGSVVNSSSAIGFNFVTLTPELLTAGRADGTFYYATNPGSLGASFALSARTNTQSPDFNAGNTNGLLAHNRSEIVRRSATAATVQKLKNWESDPAKSIAVTISNLFTTGHQPGDIRRTFLSSNVAGSVTGTVADRSYKAGSATVTGTLTAAPVNADAELVAYSGFSATDYAQEPYAADLDFGTGEWSCGAWANIPAVLPPESFPVVGPELVANGTFDTDTDWTKGENWTISGGVATTTAANLAGAPPRSLSQAGVFVTGKAYRVRGTVVSSPGRVANTTLVLDLGAATPTLITLTAATTYPVNFDVVVVAPQGNLILRTSSSVGGETPFSIDNISVKEVLPALIADRTYSSGASLRLGVDAGGRFQASAFDGTTTRTVTAPAAYNTATWIKPEAVYTTDGTLAIRVNGIEVAATRGNPLLTLNNSDAVLTIGNSYALDAPFPGSLALLKLSATVPTLEQSIWMYEQEKQLFREGAKCCLPDSGALVDLAYDEATDKWIAASAANISEWSGLVRTAVTPAPAGSYSKLAAGGGVTLQGRTTTSPGVDITIPAQGLREELVNRAEAAARLNANLATFDFVGGFTANITNGNTAITSVAGLSYPTSIRGAKVTGSGIPADTVVSDVSGTTIYLSKAATATATGVQIAFTDFALPVGYEARTISVAGALKQEGATKDFSRLFDGFKETVRFGAAPAYDAWVQITATRSQA